jgi:hypothetical protein
LDEFCYRFNRRFIEMQIPNRLLNWAIIHAPIKSTWAKCIGMLIYDTRHGPTDHFCLDYQLAVVGTEHQIALLSRDSWRII